jgi:hypothetical protein
MNKIIHTYFYLVLLGMQSLLISCGAQTNTCTVSFNVSSFGAQACNNPYGCPVPSSTTVPDIVTSWYQMAGVVGGRVTLSTALSNVMTQNCIGFLQASSNSGKNLNVSIKYTNSDGSTNTAPPYMLMYLAQDPTFTCQGTGFNANNQACFWLAIPPNIQNLNSNGYWVNKNPLFSNLNFGSFQNQQITSNNQPTWGLYFYNVPGASTSSLTGILTLTAQ